VLQNQDLVVWVDEAPPELAERLIAWLSRYRQVFSVFTTNDPGHQLPHSLQRGRIGLTENRGLNEVFFVDLPDRAQLVAIFRQLLIRHHVPLDGIDLERVATDAQGFSAQEAALVVEDALIESLSDNGRHVTSNDLVQALHLRVPGSKVRSEEIGTIRDWAEQHALRA
jgi:SpoVK/Ycf46/Vps4 family AAA+-type ATPase